MDDDRIFLEGLNRFFVSGWYDLMIPVSVVNMADKTKPDVILIEM